MHNHKLCALLFVLFFSSLHPSDKVTEKKRAHLLSHIKLTGPGESSLIPEQLNLNVQSADILDAIKAAQLQVKAQATVDLKSVITLPLSGASYLSFKTGYYQFNDKNQSITAPPVYLSCLAGCAILVATYYLYDYLSKKENSSSIKLEALNPEITHPASRTAILENPAQNLVKTEKPCV